MMNQNEAEIYYFFKKGKATFSIWEYNKHFFFYLTSRSLGFGGITFFSFLLHY